MSAWISKNTGKKENHPVINYVNNVNKSISEAANEFASNANFFVVEMPDKYRFLILTNQERDALEKQNKDCKFYIRDELKKSELIDLISEFTPNGGFTDHENELFELKENNDIALSACIMHFLGFDNVVLSLLNTAFFNEKMKLGQLKFVYHSSNVVERLKQKIKSSKPRNTNYSVALKIIKDTWEQYPAASKTEMCSKLHRHFNGSVSKDTLKRWIKKTKLQPPAPKKYTAFSLVIASE